MQVHITDQEPEPSFELGRQIFVDFDDASPTAIFATSDTTAMGLMQAAFQAGISMPDRLSIVGFDDIDFAAYTIPPLTTISQGGVEMGRVAAELLFDMIDNGRDKANVDDVILEPKLVVRGSTGAPFR
jgi:LacI family transcriptional regulator